MNEPSSSSISSRSRAVFLPRACCFSMARSDPAWATSATRRLRSASLPAVEWMSMPESESGTSVPPTESGSATESVVCAMSASLALPPCANRSTVRHCTRRWSRRVSRGRESTSTRALGSTNLEAARLAEPWRVVVTDHQQAGRGRLGRAWDTPASTSVTLSVLLPAPDQGRGWMPLATGLAVRDALAEVAGRRQRAQVAQRRAPARPTTSARSAASSASCSRPGSSSASASTSTRTAPSSPSTPPPPCGWPEPPT